MSKKEGTQKRKWTDEEDQELQEASFDMAAFTVARCLGLLLIGIADWHCGLVYIRLQNGLESKSGRLLPKK